MKTKTMGKMPKGWRLYVQDAKTKKHGCLVEKDGKIVLVPNKISNHRKELLRETINK